MRHRDGFHAWRKACSPCKGSRITQRPSQLGQGGSSGRSSPLGSEQQGCFCRNSAREMQSEIPHPLHRSLADVREECPWERLFGTRSFGGRPHRTVVPENRDPLCVPVPTGPHVSRGWPGRPVQPSRWLSLSAGLTDGSPRLLPHRHPGTLGDYSGDGAPDFWELVFQGK